MVFKKDHGVCEHQNGKIFDRCSKGSIKIQQKSDGITPVSLFM
jgi:hypothetical protein